VPARVLVIGLDSYDKDLLFEWAASGELPALGALLQRATVGVIEGPPAVYAGAVWASFNTGSHPGHHRRFFRRQAPRGEYLDVDFKPTDIQGVAFWEVLSDAGRKIAVIDVPHSKLSDHINGIQVIDWASHEPELEQATTVPAGLREQIISRFGIEPPDQCENALHTFEGQRQLLAHLEARVRSKAAMSRHYLRSEDWDFFITVFAEAHCAGHQWWHLHDPTHPARDPAVAAATGDLMKSAYIAIDRAVGEIVAAVGSDTRLLVLCSHGMGPLYGESVALDEVLRRLEPPKVKAGSLFQSMKSLWYMLPSSVRSLPVARNLRVKMQRPLHQSLLVPDRQTRRFFTIPHNPHAGAIRINLVGREAHGLVHPGAEYRAVCAELRRELLALRCPETNEEVVADVAFTTDFYDGPFVDELPDVVVEWKRSRPPRGMASERAGTVSIPEVRGRTGDHTRTGLFLATGPGLTSKRLERTVAIVDFAPTFTAWMDTPVPSSFAGQPIRELLGG
jgi:predicted AlkP superfamily phosphohydrolase/phosphomutase